jgi:glutathione S-transferase
VTANSPILYGANYSVYVRAVMMALVAKGVRYRHEPVDIFADTGIPADYLLLHPFGKIPAFQHGSFTLYETIAITRYVDEAFDGPPLQPVDTAMRARMTQIMCMTDSYGYRPLVWDIYVERSSNPKKGKATDETRIASAIPRANTYLAALNGIAKAHPWLLGITPTLADFHLAPMFGYFLKTPEGQHLLKQFPRLEDWWNHISASSVWLAASKQV